MRLHFISRLALLLTGAFLVIASQVWTATTVEWLFVAGGIVMVAFAALDSIRPNLEQAVLDGAIALLGAWTIIEAATFTGAKLTNVSLAGAIALVALNAIGLIYHEMSTERVVHELTVSSDREGVPATA